MKTAMNYVNKACHYQEYMSLILQMRSTWITKIKDSIIQNNPELQLKVFFQLSVLQSENESLAAVTKESNKYHDLVVIDMKDSYRMWSQKTLALMGYFLQECFYPEQTNGTLKLPLFIKTSDDLVINPKQFLSMIEKFSLRSSEIFCGGHHFTNAWWGPTRTPGRQDYVPTYVYPIQSWEDFVSGSAFFITLKAVKDLFEYARCSSAIMFIDDVVITGMPLFLLIFIRKTIYYLYLTH